MWGTELLIFWLTIIVLVDWFMSKSQKQKPVAVILWERILGWLK